MKLRITLLIPAILVFSAVVSSMLMFYHTFEHSEEIIRKKTVEQLNFDITRLQNILYNLLTEGKLADARLNVSMTAMASSFKKLLIIDEQENIIIANRYSWEGSKAISVTDYDVNVARAVKANNQPRFLFAKDNDTNLSLYYPVVLKIENNHGLPVKRIGILFAKVTIKRELEDAYHNALHESIYYGILILVTALLIAITLHYKISRRLSYLSNVSSRLAAGDFKARAGMSGNDEITQLADSFDEMAKQIQTNVFELNETKSTLIDLNATLEEKVTERTELLREAQSIAHLGNWQWNIQTGELTWSDEIYRIFGYQDNDTEFDLNMFMSAVHENDRQMVDAAIDAALTEGKRYSIDHRIITRDNTVRWVHEEGYISCDKNNKPEMMHGITIDITEHKQEEEQRNKLERQLLQSQKMEAIGQLTGGIAHDFNNMLASIKGFTELAQQLDVIDPSNKLENYLMYVNKATDRATNLVSQMLAFSRTDTGMEKQQVLVVADLLDDALAMLRPVLPATIELSFHADDKQAKIMTTPVMFNQLLMNLCVNARDAMRDGQGKIEISVNKVNFNNRQCASCHKDVVGDYVEIAVSDTGAGIPLDEQFHLFEPFYTTKEVGKGTGMGLAMVHGIVHKHKGHIIVESTQGKGSTFKLLFPLENTQQQLNRSADSPAENKSTQTEEKTILIVDDEVSITLFLKEFLASHGYKVISSNSSKQALDIFANRKDEIDMVITDYTMPEMTGIQIAESLHEIKPGLPVLLCSGYNEELAEDSMTKTHINEFLQKPLDTGKLLNAVREHSV